VLDLAGRTVVVTAGGTREPVDPVRFLGNRSSGRQGIAIARAAAARGANVRLIVGDISVATPDDVVVERVGTALEMRDAVRRAALGADVVVMAAAVADFRPVHAPEAKIKKAPGQPPEPILLVENPDILAELVAHPPDPATLVVGFAAETGDAEGTVLDHGRAKALRKGADLLAVNAVGEGRGFGDVANEVTVLDAAGDVVTSIRGSKDEVAHGLLDVVAARLTSRTADTSDVVSEARTTIPR